MCHVHGGHFSSLFTSRDIAWAMHQPGPVSVPYAVVTLMADGQPRLGYIASRDFIERFKLADGPLTEAEVNALDDCVRHMMPVCGLCFQERFGFVPQSGPFPEEDSGFS